MHSHHSFLFIYHISIFTWGLSAHFLEHSVEISYTSKAALTAYQRNILSSVKKQIAGLLVSEYVQKALEIH